MSREGRRDREEEKRSERRERGEEGGKTEEGRRGRKRGGREEKRREEKRRKEKEEKREEGKERQTRRTGRGRGKAAMGLTNELLRGRRKEEIKRRSKEGNLHIIRHALNDTMMMKKLLLLIIQIFRFNRRNLKKVTLNSRNNGSITSQSLVPLHPFERLRELIVELVPQ